MINQVVLAGKLTQDPHVPERPGEQSVELQLEVERLSRFGARAEKCVVLVRAFGKARVESIQRYVSKGSHVLVHGHLRLEGASLMVVSDWLEFMENALKTHALEPGSVAALAASAGARLMPVAG